MDPTSRTGVHDYKRKPVRTEERYRRALEIGTVGVIFFRTDGVITGANDAFMAMSGYDRGDLERGIVRWDVMTPTEYLEVSYRSVAELLAHGRTTPYEKEYIRKDGSRWWGLSSAIRFGEDEGAEFVVDIGERRRGDEDVRSARAELEDRVRERTRELEDRVRERTRELAAINDMLREEIAERKRAEINARELALRLTVAEQEERRRLSRVLHDDLQQILYGIRMKLGLLAATPGAERREVASTIAQLGDWLSSAIGLTRRLTVDLSPPLVEGEGLAEALGWLATQVREVHGLDTLLRVEPVDIDVDLRLLLFQIARELLFNVVKHSGTSRAQIVLREDRGLVVLQVRDDGRGIAPDGGRPRGIGLASAHARIELFGGSVSTHSVTNGGTSVTVSVPARSTRAPIHDDNDGASRRRTWQ